MIVAVVAVRMVEMPIDEVVDVIAVRHGLVAASGTVDVVRIVPRAAMLGGAADRVGLVDGERMRIDVVVVCMVQRAVVQVVDVVAVNDGRVSAIGAVNVGMIFEGFAVGHGVYSCYRG